MWTKDSLLDLIHSKPGDYNVSVRPTHLFTRRH
jgi:hypothetical protein